MRSLETAETEITDAATRTYGRVLRAIGRMITTHADGTGGLICEDRSVVATPTMWRISADGSLLPDRRYSFSDRAFMPTMFPGLTSTHSRPAASAQALKSAE